MSNAPGSLKDLRAAHRDKVEAARLPGESFQKAGARLLRQERQANAVDNQASVSPLAAQTPPTPAAIAPAQPSSKTKPAPKGRPRRAPPPAPAQADFFLPALYDVGTRDSRGVMDVALFKLTKKDHPSQIIRHELPDGFVEVKAGPDGLASVWDYDIILMAISHLTEAMNRHREGKGELPGRTFKPHIGELMKFLRRTRGGRQRTELLEGLKRLTGTVLAIERTGRNGRGKLVTVAQGEPLIAGYTVHQHPVTRAVEFVEIEVAKWMHQEIVAGTNPDVLTVHPDYFLIEQGIARFLYRLARRAAGRTQARWGFATIYARSGSTGPLKKFSHTLRQIIAENALPEYELGEEAGPDGPQLVMTYRNRLDAVPNRHASPVS